MDNAALETVRADLAERVKELSCLYDISRLIERDDLAIDAILAAVAARLPPAMRYPSIAVASIEHAGQSFGRSAEGETPGKTPATTYQALWAALNAGESWTGELVNRTKDGRERTELAHILPLRDTDGRVRHYVALKEDITETKRMADAGHHQRHP